MSRSRFIRHDKFTDGLTFIFDLSVTNKYITLEMTDVKFGTVINCMDGRTQLPAIRFIKEKYNLDYIDTITEAGPVKILSDWKDEFLIKSILYRLNISFGKHKSTHLAIIAHHDCAGNPVDKNSQLIQLNKAVENLKNEFQDINIFGLWIGSEWNVEPI